jgi:pyridinium-3,5-biscarboxylic acid mononucleotide sulfurtransferase
MKNPVKIENAEQALKEVLTQYDSLAIAVSGGADSTFLATFATKIFPKDKLLPVHAVLPFSPKQETKLIKQWAKDNNIDLKVMELDILEEEDVRKNDRRRCYYCKHAIMSNLICEVRKLGIANIADGTVLDDFGDYRPGLKATGELGIIHPLADAGFNKKVTRALARRYGLPNWRMPASACLASRIPYDTPLDKKTLEAVGEAEEYITKLGFPGCRVRVMDKMCGCIEVNPIYLQLILKKRKDIAEKLKKLGFNRVTLDLDGYRRGSLN